MSLLVDLLYIDYFIVSIFFYVMWCVTILCWNYKAKQLKRLKESGNGK